MIISAQVALPSEQKKKNLLFGNIFSGNQF